MNDKGSIGKRPCQHSGYLVLYNGAASTSFNTFPNNILTFERKITRFLSLQVRRMFLTAAIAILITGLLKALLSFNNWWYVPVLKPDQAPLPPGSLGWPIFGNMPAFLRAFKSGKPNSFMGQYVSKFGRIGLYKAFLFWQPTVIAATPEACRLVLSKPASFETGWPKSAVQLSGVRSYAGISGEEHLTLRKLTDPLLQGPNILQEYVPVIVRNVKACLERWSKQEKVLLLPELRRFTSLTILRVLYGEKWELNIDETFALYFKMNRGIRAFPLNIPGTAYNKALKARGKLVKIIKNEIDARRASGETNARDTLSLLLRQTNSKGEHLEDTQIIDMLNMFMNAGHDSTAHVIMWLMILLQKHPDVLQKLKAEQDAIAKRKAVNNEILSYSDIKSMPYLADVIDETLRFANISPMVFRKSMEDVEFAGFTIPKNWHVQAWLRQLHMDPCNHPEPQNFDPERWTKYRPAPFTFVPFGMGHRTCPGNELAKLQMFIAVHYLVTGYEWKPLNPGAKLRYLPHPRPEDLCPVKMTKLKPM